jgi:hypothetical protein
LLVWSPCAVWGSNPKLDVKIGERDTTIKGGHLCCKSEKQAAIILCDLADSSEWEFRGPGIQLSPTVNMRDWPVAFAQIFLHCGRDLLLQPDPQGAGLATDDKASLLLQPYRSQRSP